MQKSILIFIFIDKQSIIIGCKKESNMFEEDDIHYARIKKDCFWDLSISEEDIEDIIKGNDERKKRMLFEKILLNSTALFKDLQIFKKEELENFMNSYKIPEFNAEYVFKRKNMAEVYFFNKPLLIDELKWIA